MIIITYYSSWTGGHVALSLTGLDSQDNIHISIYPPNRSVPNMRLHSVEYDGHEAATEIVVIPTEESCGYGLSEKAIRDWWKNEYDPKSSGSYSLFGRNCASAAYKALCIGQEKSVSLEHQVIPHTTYIVSLPANIVIYAKKIIETILQKHTTFNELYLKYAELKEYCRTDKEYIPYDQILGFYFRLKQFNQSKDYCLTINKPFCDGIKNTLIQFKSALEKIEDDELKLVLNIINFSGKDDQPAISTLDHLISLTNVTHLAEADIDAHFTALQTLTNTICKLTANEEKPLFALLNLIIKKESLTTLFQYLSTADLFSIKEKERMKEVFTVLKDKIDDRNNPHAPHISKVTDVVTSLVGLT